MEYIPCRKNNGCQMSGNRGNYGNRNIKSVDYQRVSEFSHKIAAWERLEHGREGSAKMSDSAVHARAICPYYQASYQRKNGSSAIACEGLCEGSRTVSEFRDKPSMDRWMRKACESYQYCEVCAIARVNAGKYERGDEENGC